MVFLISKRRTNTLGNFSKGGAVLILCGMPRNVGQILASLLCDKHVWKNTAVQCSFTYFEQCISHNGQPYFLDHGHLAQNKSLCGFSVVVLIVLCFGVDFCTV